MTQFIGRHFFSTFNLKWRMLYPWLSMGNEYNYWVVVWGQFKRRWTGVIALCVLGLFFLVGLYAPLLASSKPILVVWDGKLFFPLFRYLFYPGFYTKPIDLFFNVLMFTFPIGLAMVIFLKGRWKKPALLGLCFFQFGLFILFWSGLMKDPAGNLSMASARREVLENHTTFSADPLLTPLSPQPNWAFELQYMTPYAKLNALLRNTQYKAQHRRLSTYANLYEEKVGRQMPTLWNVDQRNKARTKERLVSTLRELKGDYLVALDTLPGLMAAYRPYSHAFVMAKHEFEHDGENKTVEKKYAETINQAAPFRAPLIKARNVIHKYQEAYAKLNYMEARQNWLDEQGVRILVPALIRPFHWEEDAGGAQAINQYIPWWELTRINRKDLVSSLLFGIRISLVVGVTAIVLSLLIGIPLGMTAAYFAGKTDIVISRFIEIWEAMPTFFMLLLVVAITQSKSIFLVIAVLGIFGWTGFGRFMRAEVLKQRHLPYVSACQSLGYRHGRIMFSHILPNAIPPILTLLPFSMMAAITSEAGLSFLGLGEEGSTSWGVLMDEGRSVFPGESYLLWPPAILLTILLISIALIGDVLRDAIDPKMRS